MRMNGSSYVCKIKARVFTRHLVTQYLSSFLLPSIYLFIYAVKIFWNLLLTRCCTKRINMGMMKKKEEKEIPFHIKLNQAI